MITIQNMKRNMSEREKEVRMLSRQVQEMERDIRNHMSPYANDIEEHESLISQSINHDMEEAARRRSYDQ